MKHCEACGSLFTPHPYKQSQRFCTEVCGKRAWSQARMKLTWTARECAHCGESFARVSRMSHKQKYCTLVCRQAAARAIVPQRWRHVSSRYGLSQDALIAMLELQERCCAICSVELNGTGRERNAPQVDHDHETGGLRAILCRSCNTALGSFKDDPETVANALAYLLKWKREGSQRRQVPARRASGDPRASLHAV